MPKIWIAALFTLCFCSLQGQRRSWLPEFSGGVFPVLHAERFNQIFSEQFRKPKRIISIERNDFLKKPFSRDEASRRYLKGFPSHMSHAFRWEMDENARLQCFCEVEKDQRPCEKNSIRTVFHYNSQGKPDTVFQWDESHTGEGFLLRHIFHYNSEGNPDTVKTLSPGGKTSLLVFEYENGLEVAMKSGETPDHLRTESLMTYNARGKLFSEMDYNRLGKNGEITDTTYASYTEFNSKERGILFRHYYPYRENGEWVLKLSSEFRNLIGKKFQLSDSVRFASEPGEDEVDRTICEYKSRKKLLRYYMFRGTHLEEVQWEEEKNEPHDKIDGVVYTYKPDMLDHWKSIYFPDGKGNFFRRISIRKDPTTARETVEYAEQYKFEYR